MPGVSITTLLSVLCPSTNKKQPVATEEDDWNEKKTSKTALPNVSIKRGTHSDQNCNRCAWIWAAIITLFLIVVGVNIFLLTWVARLQEDQLQALRRLQEYEKKPVGCVPCQRIRLSPADDRTNLRIFHVNKKTDECCAKDSVQLGRLLDLSFERKYRLAKATGTFDVPKIIYVDASNGTKYLSNNKPSAHLMATYDMSHKYGDEESELPLMIRKWNHDKDIAFVTDGLEYKDGRLIVHKEGTYYIYSNIAFLKYYMKERERALSDHSLMHIVARYNIIYPNGGEERLFEASLSQCWAKHKRYGEYVSHLGGVLRLNRGDEIYVKVRDIRALVQRPKATYFGVYSI